MKRIDHKLYLVFFCIFICISLIGCSAGEYVEEIDDGNSSNPVPYYEIDGVEVDQMMFESELEERITNQMLERSIWTANNTTNDAVLQLKPCAAYQDILGNAYEIIITDSMTDIVPVDELFSYDGIREAEIGRDTSEALAGIGYTFYDVDGNGIEELIIADMLNDDGGRWDNRILLMYTLHDDKPVLLIDGWARNRYYLLNDGTIYHEGSGGAAYTSFGIYHIADDGSRLEAIDYYYSGSYSGSVYGWFHNTTGEKTEDKSEAIEFENEDIPWNMMEDYMVQVKELELTFFDKFLEDQ